MAVMMHGHEVELEGEVAGVALGQRSEFCVIGARAEGKRLFLWLDARLVKAKAFKEAAAALSLEAKADAPKGLARLVWEVSAGQAEAFRALVGVCTAWAPRAPKAGKDGQPEPLVIESVGPIAVTPVDGGWDLRFPYDEAMAARVRRLAGSAWKPAPRKAWHVPRASAAPLARLLQRIRKERAEEIAAAEAEQRETDAVVAATREALKAADRQARFSTRTVAVALYDTNLCLKFAYDEDAVAAVKTLPGAKFTRPAGPCTPGLWQLFYKDGVTPEALRGVVARIDALLSAAETARKEAAEARRQEEAERRRKEALEAWERKQEERARDEASGIHHVSRLSNGKSDGAVGDIEWVGGWPCRVLTARKEKVYEPGSLGYMEAYDRESAWVVHLRCKRLTDAEARPLLDRAEADTLADSIPAELSKLGRELYDLLRATPGEDAERCQGTTWWLEDAMSLRFAITKPGDDNVVVWEPSWSVPDGSSFTEYDLMKPRRRTLMAAERAAFDAAMAVLEQPWATRPIPGVDGDGHRHLVRCMGDADLNALRERAAQVADARSAVKAALGDRTVHGWW